MSEDKNATLRKEHVPENLTVGFIGAGRMAQAMVRGFLSAGILKASNIIASAPHLASLQDIQSMGVQTTQDNLRVVTHSQMVILAVKPHLIIPVLKEISSSYTLDKIIVSIAAGITLSTLEQHLQANARVIRVMPNTPVLVRAGASFLAPGPGALSEDISLMTELLGSIGVCEIGPEKLLDAVTGVSGSGTAYAFVAMESMADGGVKMGLPRKLAQKLAAQALLGAASLVLETGKHPAQLKDEVCSPGGTTIAAIHKLDKGGFRGALMDAVETAALKAKELGTKI